MKARPGPRGTRTSRSRPLQPPVHLGGLGQDLLADLQPPEDPPIGPQKTDLRSLLKNVTIANAKWPSGVGNLRFGSRSDYRHRHPGSPFSEVKQTELVGKRTLPLEGRLLGVDRTRPGHGRSGRELRKEKTPAGAGVGSATVAAWSFCRSRRSRCLTSSSS